MENESGKCWCGCGKSAPIASRNDPRFGWIKGQPKRYIHNHHMRPRDPAVRFWEKVKKGDVCWTWQASKRPNGYGQFMLDGQPALAHRVVYELCVGPIPEGLQIDHLCRNRACVNPDHLEVVTQRENLRRGNGWAGRNARKTTRNSLPMYGKADLWLQVN